MIDYGAIGIGISGLIILVVVYRSIKERKGEICGYNKNKKR